MNSHAYLYIWGAHQLLLLAAFVVYKLRLISAVDTEDGVITYSQFYYNARRAFTLLASSLLVYKIAGKWLLGWRIDNWWVEAALVLLAMAMGHITFIAARNTDGIDDIYSRLKRPYKLFAFLFVLSLYGRLLLATLSLFSFNNHFSYSLLPDIRYNDLYLLNDYYLSYAGAKGIVVEEKLFIFSKDIASLSTFSRSMCNFHGYDFTTADEPSVPFPFTRRVGNDVLVLTNPVQKNGYMRFALDSSGVLVATAYVYATADARVDASYMPCGTVTIK